ncbi:hypothetical protein [Chitinophaga nivalis]|uniref:Serine/threonine protein kinase n=1 Tax=Chitinophaga nivalis TaxID=2991709 RepID=A0ABT3IHF8_9BACT|nr:hypothetical protein [Chitinophaga nivalis]MCW3467074.1 hypothetical protein [Chitinophaga nivalis]MCW3483235.1 hypothetical protein [Chitinophaga nivalis]
MENTDILQIWDSYHQKLEASLQLNRQNAVDITRLKVQSLIASMQPIKIFALLTGVLWVLFVDGLIITLYPVANVCFLVSAVMQVLLTKLAIGIYLYQLILIRQVDISEPILATQEKIARLQSTSLWVARLLFLQLPVWTTFYLNATMLANGHWLLWLLQGAVTIGFTVLAIWLFVRIRFENRHEKWFRWIFGGKEWLPVIKSWDLLQQLAAYEEPVEQ